VISTCVRSDLASLIIHKRGFAGPIRLLVGSVQPTAGGQCWRRFVKGRGDANRREGPRTSRHQWKGASNATPGNSVRRGVKWRQSPHRTAGPRRREPTTPLRKISGCSFHHTPLGFPPHLSVGAPLLSTAL
jgi:hypothetical protein